MDGLELRRRRQALGLTQAQLAKELDTPQPTIARWETGANPIIRARLVDLALCQLEERKEAPVT